MLKYLILGVIQGFTEFLPISSSGHLVIAQHLLDMNQNTLFITTLLHLGTIFAILTFFSKDIWKALKDPKKLLYIIATTVITGSIALIFKENFESLFVCGRTTAIFLIVNGLILVLTKNIKNGKKEVNLPKATLMGLTQAFAIAPGISRSGITITTLLITHTKKETAFTFSFIASIPLVIAAFFLELRDIPNSATLDLKSITVGIIVAFISGLCALKLLKKIIKLEKFYLFGYYCIAIGLCTAFFLVK